MNQSKRIPAFVDSHKQEMLALLKKIVNIDSPSSSPEDVQKVGSILLNRLENLGFRTEVLPGDNYADHVFGEIGSGKPTFFLMGHMDTVFPLGTVQERPFALSEDGEKAFGPGVLDMKSGLVSILFAIKALLRPSSDLNFKIKVLFNGDEEPGSPESRQYLEECLDGATFAFVLEPAAADGTMVTLRKGVGIYTLKAKGKAAHAGSSPEKGANAIDELIRHVANIEKLEDKEKGTTINVGTIHGGTEPYVVAEEAKAEIDLRVPTLEEQSRVEKGITQDSAQTYISGTTLEFSGGFHRPPMETVERTDYLKNRVRQAAESLGEEASFTEVHRGGASDGNLIAAEGVPCLDGMGPRGTGSHSDQEFIDVPSFFYKCKLLATTLRLLEGASE